MAYQAIAAKEPATMLPPREPRRKRRAPWKLITLLLAPALALYLLFVIAPLAQALFYSLFKWNGLEPLDQFIGVKNYLRLFGDATFVRALMNNISVIVASLAIQLPFALWIATMLNGNFRGRTVFRLVFFVPYIISEVVSAVLWNLLLSPQSGVVNETLRAVGLDGLAHPWLGDPATVMGAVLFVVNWKFFGFYTVLFLAALQALPHDILEAARIDGASRWETFWYVTLPMLGPSVRIAIFLSVVGSLQLFDLVWVMTEGGPVGASSTMVTYMISNGLRNYQFGYASAVAVTVAIISFVFALIYQRAVLARDYDFEPKTRKARRG